jgi:pilus assembly protein CpaE
MVTTPHLNSIQNSRVMLDIWEKLLNYPPAKIMMILNKHRRERGGINVESIENHFKRQFNMIVPSEERAIEGSVRRGVPVVAGDRNMSPAKEFIQLAEVVRGEFMEFEEEEEEFELEEEKTSLFGGLFRR